MTQNFPVGTLLNQNAFVTTPSAEYTTGNNSSLATGSVQSSPDVWITKTLAPFTGFTTGDHVYYTITYGNSGGKAANNVVISDIPSAYLTIAPATSFSLGTLPA